MQYKSKRRDRNSATAPVFNINMAFSSFSSNNTLGSERLKSSIVVVRRQFCSAALAPAVADHRVLESLALVSERFCHHHVYTLKSTCDIQKSRRSIRPQSRYVTAAIMDVIVLMITSITQPCTDLVRFLISRHSTDAIAKEFGFSATQIVLSSSRDKSRKLLSGAG